MALSHRVERIAEQIREELSQMISTEVSDPGVGLVTVTRVKVTPDLSLARVYWTVLGETKDRKESGKALNRAVPYLRHLLGFMGLTDVTFVRAEKIGFGPQARAAAISAATESLRATAQEFAEAA